MVASLLSAIDKVRVFSLLFFLGAFAVIVLALLCVGVKAVIHCWPALSVLRKVHGITVLLCLFAILNFLVGVGIVEEGILGGTARDGKLEHGQFYLHQKGRYTRVSATTYNMCWYYEQVVVGLCLVSVAATGVSYVVQRPPRKSFFVMLHDYAD